MKKSILVIALVAVMLLGSVSGIGTFVTAYASSSASPTITSAPKHEHVWGDYDIIAEPTEGKNGLIRFYCTAKDNGKACAAIYEELIPDLPDTYVNKYRHKEAGLTTRITIAEAADYVSDGEMKLTVSNWNATLMGDQYAYNWEDDHIKQRFLEFKVEDIGIGTFDDKVDTYTFTIPTAAVTNCEENGDVVVFLTTGAAMVRLGKDATAAIIGQAKETFGVKASCDGEKLTVELLADGKVIDTPNGVEMLYWVKDAGDEETATDDVLKSVEYMNFKTEGDFDLIFVESLNGVVNCNH